MSKCQKTSNAGHGEDYFSLLPKELLILILSFLPTVEAIRCSILFSNWKNLWTFLSVLDLKGSKTTNFMRLVDNVLRLHDLSCAKRFRLKCSTAIDASIVCKWLKRVTSHNIQEIDLELNTGYTFTLPWELLTCSSLVSLRVISGSRVSFPFFLNLPQLKDINMSPSYPINAITRKLFCRFPVLENLEISSPIDNDEYITFDLAAPALKILKLDLHADDYFCNEDVPPNNIVVVNAPMLEHLTVVDDYLAIYSLNNLSSLVEASIDVGTCCMQVLGTHEHACHLLMLLQGITNVKCLTLYPQTMGVLDCMIGVTLPCFQNLTHLVVCVYNCYSFERFIDLLSSAPNLVTLELIRNFAHEDDLYDNFNWVEPKKRPACFLSHLEEMEIFGFKALKCELSLLKYLLKNAKALKRVKLNSQFISLKKRRHFLRQLARSKKGSKTCTFELITEFRPLV